MIDLGQTQDQQLINKHNRVRQKFVRRSLLLVSLLNLLTFFCFVFAMSFYQWIWVQFQFPRDRLDSKVHRYWVNLLYLKQDTPGSQYQSFGQVQKRLCLTNIYCSATFYELHFIGYLCFFIFSVPIILQLIQFMQMIYYIVAIGKVIQTKSNFKHIISIATYTIGLTLNAFSFNVMDNIRYQIGLCYWLCVGVIALFLMIIVYGKFSIRKMVKQALIQNLLDLEKTARCQKMKINSNVLSRSQSGQQLSL